MPCQIPGGLDRNRGGGLGPYHSQGRLQDPVCQPPSSHLRSSYFWILLSRLGKRQGIGNRSQTPEVERGYRRSSTFPRLLQSSFCGNQVHRRLQAHPRLVNSQPLCSYDQISDGNGSNSYVCYQRERLDGLSRPSGRLFSGPSTPRKSKIPPVHLGRESVPVSGPLLWSSDGASGLYQNDGSSFSGFTSPGNTSATILGRLASSGFLREGGIQNNTIPPQPMLKLGHNDQLGKVISIPIADHDLSRDGDSLTLIKGFPNRKKTCESARTLGVIPVTQRSPCKGLDDPVGSHVFPHTHDSGCQEKNEESPGSAFSAVGPAGAGRLFPYSLDRQLPGGSSMVVTKTKSPHRSVSHDGFARPVPVHRRVVGGLGSLSPSRFHKRHMVTTREDSPHQPFRTSGNPSRSSPFYRDYERQDSSCLLGQCHSSVLHCQGGRYSVGLSQRRSPEDFTVGGGSLGQDSNSVRQGIFQCVGGLSQQTIPGNIDGMDAPSRCLQSSVEALGLPDGRSLCYKTQLQAAKFRVTFPGSSGHRDRCLPVQLGSSRSLCFSSLSSGQESAKQIKFCTEHQPHPDSPVLASEGMVPGSHASVSRHTQTSPFSQRPFKAAPCSSFPSRSPRASSNRVETVKRLLHHKGYSSRVSHFLARSKRSSTLVNYQHKWRKYRQWCKKKGHTISNPSSQKFADFLVFLRTECNLSTSAIKGYKSMLNGIFTYNGFDMSRDPVLRDVIKACSARVHKPIQNRTPSWNVDIVLKALTRTPYEPLHLCSRRDLTKKTLFLVALATAKRVGELQSLSCSVAKQGNDLLLSYLPEFIAKTESDINPIPREFCLRSLAAIVGREDEERLLCPVRALKWYRHVTSSPTRPRNLFLSVKDQR